MNTQMERARGHTSHEEDAHMHDQDVGIQTGHNDEGHDDKKSVMRKVKDKAKKIKHSIAEHVGHGHELHGHDHDEVEGDEMDTDPETHAAQSFRPGEVGVTKQHEPRLGDRTAAEGVPVSKPGDYQNLDWTRTDTGRPVESKEQFYASKDTPVVGTERPMGMEKDTQVPKAVGEARHPPNYQAQVAEPISAVKQNHLGTTHGAGEERNTHGTHTTQGSRQGEVGVTKQHEPRLGDRTTVEGVSVSKPGDYQTLDWTRTDTGRPKESMEQPYASKNAPVVGTERPIGMEKDTQVPKAGGEAHRPASYQAKVVDPTSTGTTHGAGAEERNTGKLGGIIESPPALEKDPHSPRDPWEKRHAENYESKESDPTGEGGEEIGVTPILHQLDKINIYEEPQHESNVRTGQEESIFKPKHSPEDQKISTGSHNQFSPEPITSETSKFLQAPKSESQTSGHEGSHDKSEQEQGSYTEKISSAAAMMADKAKQATSSVTSKLGYGGNSDQHPTASSGLHGKQPETGGYGEKISTATAAIAGRAVQAKDVVATKLGYGGTHEREPVQEGASKGGSVIETVKGTIAPVYGKVAEVGSTVASKVQGPGTEHEVGPDAAAGPTADKGVSMKQYLVEKLKPGEDDKALSDVITEALPLHKHKDDISKVKEEEGKRVNIKGKVTESEEVARKLGKSDDVSKVEEEGEGKRVNIKGRVTESEEVARKLGKSDDVSKVEEEGEGKRVNMKGRVTESEEVARKLGKSDDVSKVEEEGEGKRVNMKGRVTESEEVAQQLGKSEEASYEHAKGVMDRIKDAFGYQKSGETPATDTTEGYNKGSSSIYTKEDEQKRE